MNEEQIETAAVPEAEEYEVVSVVFRTAGKAYYFEPNGTDPRPGEAVIVETARGLEFGKIKKGRMRVSRSAVVLPLRPVVRMANSDDMERYLANCDQEKYALRVCKEKAAEHKLDIRLVSAEYTFDNRKLIFYFTAESRVDFRELVKTLAAIFRVRIELRQIGIRDEARMLGGLGVCGRPFCCAGFLSDFVQVSIRMAKEQNFSLNSNKISGSCGRLMCCLRYEHDTYEAALRELPSVGTHVRTPAGDGVVSEVRSLSGILRVRYEGEAPRLYAATDVVVLRNRNGEYVPVETPVQEAPRSDEDPVEKTEDAVLSSGEAEAGAEDASAVQNSRNQHNGRNRHRSRHKKNGQGEPRPQGERPAGEGAEGASAEKSDTPRREGRHNRHRHRPRGNGQPKKPTGGEG